MSTDTQLDRIRRYVIESAERSEKNLVLFLWLFAVLELAAGASYVIFAWYGFSLVVLIGVAAACVYIMLTAAMFGLKAHIDACTARIVKAVELTVADDDE